MGWKYKLPMDILSISFYAIAPTSAWTYTGGRSPTGPGYCSRSWTAASAYGAATGWGCICRRTIICTRCRIQTPWRFFLVLRRDRSEEHTSELQSLMRISYAVFCLKKKILLFFHLFFSYYVVLIATILFYIIFFYISLSLFSFILILTFFFTFFILLYCYSHHSLFYSLLISFISTNSLSTYF